MRFSSTCTFLLLGLAVSPASSQSGSGAAAQTAAKAADLCSLDGRVLDAVTGEPLKKATVTLTLSNANPAPATSLASLPQQFSTSSDASGRFAMKDLDPGAYRLQASRAGFVAAEYGSRGPSKPGTPLTLVGGQQAKDLEVKLTPHGVIAGRVLDEDGDPAASMMVQLLRPTYTGGKKQLTTAGSGQTNDLGEYRIFGLPPGRYYVTAGSLAAGLVGSIAVDRSAVPQPEENYVATYYPGVTDPASATPVDVAPGAQIRGIDISLAKRRTVRVSGSVSAPAPVPLLILAPRSLAGALSMRMVRVDSQGKFEIRGVPPGAYTLSGAAQQNGKTLSSKLSIEVGQSHIEGLLFTVGPGVAVSGRVRVEGDATVDISKVKVRLQPREIGLGTLLGAMGSLLSGGELAGDSGKLDDHLGFRFDDVKSDLYDVSFTGLPDGYFIKSERSGSADVLVSGLDVSNAAPEAVEIVLSPHGGQITGTVRTAGHQLAAQATVALIPRDKERIGQTAYYHDAAVGQDGQFHFKSVPPGDYKLFAWEDVESGAWLDPDFMQPLDDRGYAITVHPDGHENAELMLFPAGASVK